MTAPQTVADVQHTPGPWLVTENGTIYALDETGTANRFSAHVQAGYTYCSRHTNERTTQAEVDAVVSLMAAAPALKDALEQIRKYVADAFEGTVAAPQALDAIDDLARAALRAAATSARQGETK